MFNNTIKYCICYICNNEISYIFMINLDCSVTHQNARHNPLAGNPAALCHFVDKDLLSLLVTFLAIRNTHLSQAFCLKLVFLNLELKIMRDSLRQPPKYKLPNLDKSIISDVS